MLLFVLFSANEEAKSLPSHLYVYYQSVTHECIRQFVHVVCAVADPFNDVLKTEGSAVIYKCVAAV